MDVLPSTATPPAMRSPERWLAVLRIAAGVWFAKAIFTKLSITWAAILRTASQRSGERIAGGVAVLGRTSMRSYPQGVKKAGRRFRQGAAALSRLKSILRRHGMAPTARATFSRPLP